MKNYLYTSFVVILSFLLLSCETNNKLNSLFDPKDFAENQASVINDTAELGPQSQESYPVDADRRIYIDENMVTDYTKIISKNFV